MMHWRHHHQESLQVRYLVVVHRRLCHHGMLHHGLLVRRAHLGLPPVHHQESLLVRYLVLVHRRLCHHGMLLQKASVVQMLPSYLAQVTYLQELNWTRRRLVKQRGLREL
jgi:hypothetical protein